MKDKKFTYKISLSSGESEIGDIEAKNYDEAREGVCDMFIEIEENSEEDESENEDKREGKEHKNIKAITILELIAETINKPEIFDGETWYELEDKIMEIINK
jgi:hypothetical protein